MLYGFRTYASVISAYKKRIFIGYGYIIVRSYCKVGVNGVYTGIIKVNDSFFIAFS